MTTSMLDALADEARAVTDLGIAASRLAMEAAARANLLHGQIAHLAAEQRRQANTESRDTPGNMPAARDSGAGKQGSDASVPGDAATWVNTESEQAVAEAVTGERGFEPRKDPETAPDGGGVRLGEICEIDLTDRIVSRLGDSITLARHELRMVLALNDGRAIDRQQMMNLAGVMTYRSLERAITKVNPRLDQIGVQIADHEDHLYTLRTTR